MDATWEEQGARAERQRRRQVLALLAVIVAVGLVWAYPRARSDNERLGTTPGFESAERSVDTRPFSLAEPAHRSGSTTIPGGPGATTSTSSTTTPTTTTTAPPTTTTTLPPEIGYPAGDEVCAALGLVASLYRDSGPLEKDPRALATRAADMLGQTIGLLRATGDKAYDPAIVYITKVQSRVRQQTTLEGVNQEMHPLLTMSTPEVAAVAQPIIAHAATTCPALAAAGP